MGRFQVVLTEKASADLAAIAAYIAENKADLAERYCNELIDQVLSLSNFPKMGRIVPELGSDMVRELIRNPYRIIYRLNETEQLIEVLRFWHSAHGVPSLYL